MKKAKIKKCAGCGKDSAHLGPLSGKCPTCQNEDVASLEKEMSLPAGSLGRVNEQGEEVE